MDKIEYMYQKKQVERDIKYMINTYGFSEIDAIEVLINKYSIRIEAAKDLLIAKGGKNEK